MNTPPRFVTHTMVFKQWSLPVFHCLPPAPTSLLKVRQRRMISFSGMAYSRYSYRVIRCNGGYFKCRRCLISSISPAWHAPLR